MGKLFEGFFIPNKPLKKGEKFRIRRTTLKNAEAFASAYGVARGGGRLEGKLITTRKAKLKELIKKELKI